MFFDDNLFIFISQVRSCSQHLWEKNFSKIYQSFKIDIIHIRIVWHKICQRYSRACDCTRLGIKKRERNGPTIPIINISRSFSELHLSKEGTCIAGAFYSSRTLGTLFTFSDVYRLHIALGPKVLFVFKCVRAHAGWFSSFFPFFSPSLRHLPLDVLQR